MCVPASLVSTHSSKNIQNIHLNVPLVECFRSVCSQRMKGHADGFSCPVLFDGSMLVHAVRVVLVELLPLN